MYKTLSLFLGKWKKGRDLFLESAVSQLFLFQNNSFAIVAYFRVACSNLLQNLRFTFKLEICSFHAKFIGTEKFK